MRYPTVQSVYMATALEKDKVPAVTVCDQNWTRFEEFYADSECTNGINILSGGIPYKEDVQKLFSKQKNLSQIYIDDFRRFREMLRNSNKFLASKHNSAVKACSRSCPTQCELEYYRLHASISIRNWEECLSMQAVGQRMFTYTFFESGGRLIIEHLGMFSFPLLVAQFGGLVGLYFGLAITDVSDGILKRFGVLKAYVNIVLKPLFVLICCYQCSLIFVDYLRFETTTEIRLEKKLEGTARLPVIGVQIQTPFLEKFIKHSLSFIPRQQTIKWSKQRNVSKKVKVGMRHFVPTSFDVRFFYDRTKVKEVGIDLFLDSSLQMITAGNTVFAWHLSKTLDSVQRYEDITAAGLYHFKVGLKRFENLPPPFDDCVDSESETSNWNYEPRETQMCLKECLSESNKHRFNCTNYHFDTYSIETSGRLELTSQQDADFKLCSEYSYLASLKSAEEVAKYRSLKASITTNCLQNCRSPCTTYYYDISKIDYPRGSVNGSLAQIRVWFDERRFIARYIAQPKMSLFDLFYECGGLMSLWFGLAIIDIVCGFICYCLRKIKRVYRKVRFCLFQH